MKVFQIVDGFCFSEVTQKFKNAAATVGYFPPSVLFVDAPDYVFQGWAYDGEKDGDDRFIKPVAPEGWAYDDTTGTFYNLNYVDTLDTPVKQREYLYNTEKSIEWEGEKLTVTAASNLWQYYAAEGSAKAYNIQSLIIDAKADIRKRYPD